MGHVRHDALIVTSWSVPRLATAHQVAVEFFGARVSPLVRYAVNIGTKSDTPIRVEATWSAFTPDSTTIPDLCRGTYD